MLADLVAVMDRLRSPGGCPWDAEQTHASLLPYAVEEVHEVVEAVESGDREHLREELGDLLLQVVFHARIAQEHPDDPFGLDEVAAGLAAKLRRRHPHVFGDVESEGDVTDDVDVPGRWERIKQAEKARESVLDGVPATMPALARAQKVVGRLRRAGLLTEALAALDEHDSPGLGRRLLDTVVAADLDGVDAAAELRAQLRELEGRARVVERARQGG